MKQCDKKSDLKSDMIKHIKENHEGRIFTRSSQIPVVDQNVAFEKKEWTLNELNAFEKKKSFMKKDPAKIRESQNGFRRSVSIDLNTGCFEMMKRGGFKDMAEKEGHIKQILTTKLVTDNTGSASVEYQGEISLTNVSMDETSVMSDALNNMDFKVKIKMWTTN